MILENYSVSAPHPIHFEKLVMKSLRYYTHCALLLCIYLSFTSISSKAQSKADLPNPIMFVTQLPMPDDWMMITQSFGNHLGDVPNSGRGGDLYIYYPAQDSLKNLTALAGFGTEGFQGAVPASLCETPIYTGMVTKAVFSMVVGATERQYQHDRSIIGRYMKLQAWVSMTRPSLRKWPTSRPTTIM